MKRPPFLLLSLLTTMMVAARPPLERQQWEQPWLATFTHRGAWLQDTRTGRTQEVRLPDNSRCPSRLDGIWRCVQQRKEEDGRLTYHMKRSEDGTGWEDEATFQQPPFPKGSALMAFLPLPEEGWFLAQTVSSLGFIHEGKASTHAVFRRMGKEIRFSHLVPLAFEGMPLNLPKPAHNKDGLIGYFNPMTRMAHPLLETTFTAGEYQIVLAPRAGIAFVLDRKGRLHKTVPVPPGLDKKDLREEAELDWAILSAQPREDGTLLIATRTREASLEGFRRFNRERTLDRMKDKAWMESLPERDEEALKAHPELLWWVLDPATGMLEAQTPPQNVPRQFRRPQDLVAFRFRYKSDGNLLVSHGEVPPGKEST